MKPLVLTDDLRRVAARCVWFESAERAVCDPARFAAYVLTHGTFEDTSVLLAAFGEGELREVLDHAPPGIFDGRSWAYWNLMAGRDETPPLPVRRLPG